MVDWRLSLSWIICRDSQPASARSTSFFSGKRDRSRIRYRKDCDEGAIERPSAALCQSAGLCYSAGTILSNNYAGSHFLIIKLHHTGDLFLSTGSPDNSIIIGTPTNTRDYVSTGQ